LFLTSKPCEYFIICLIIFYIFLVFVSFGITDIDTQGTLSGVINILVYVELSILIIFTLEIMANVYAYGFKFYFRDKWLLFDAIVILGSIALVIVDLSVDGTFNAISKIVRAIFRLLRIFLLFRKVNKQFFFFQIRKRNNRSTNSRRLRSPIQDMMSNHQSRKL